MVWEQWAYRSRWRWIHPGAKGLVTLAAFASAFLASWPWYQLLLALTMALAATLGGGIPLRIYLRGLLPPLAFLLVGTATLAVSIQAGTGSWPLVVRLDPGQYPLAALVASRSLACLSALLFLSGTTPLNDLLVLLRRLKVPPVLLEIMSLGYRTIFIFAAAVHDMTLAQKARLGYATVRAARRSLGGLVAVLAAQIGARAGAMTMAASARGGEGPLLFLEHDYPPCRRSFLAAGGAALVMVGAALFAP
jgi:cobalt/nickel transport system permease protein